MAPRPYPSSSYSLELDFQPNSGDIASPQETDASHPEETHHALQNDRARTPAAVPGAPPELASSKTLLSTLDRYAADLKALHNHWTQTLSRERPESAPSQIASEALELALQELRDALPAESTPNGDSPEPLSLDAAMAHIRRRTPPA